MTFEQVQEKAEAFFEFPTADKDRVTTTSAILFARECAISARADGIAWAERFTAEQCVEIAERQAAIFKPGSWDKQACFSVANRIRGYFKLH